VPSGLRLWVEKGKMIFSLRNETNFSFRKLEKSDEGELCKLFDGSQIMSSFGVKITPLTSNAVRQWIDLFECHWREKGYGVWTVRDNHSGRFIGYCGLQSIEGTSGAEILQGFCDEFLGSEDYINTTRAAIHFGFSDANLSRVFALVDDEAVSFLSSMPKTGMREVSKISVRGRNYRLFSVSNISRGGV
jgi:RimJ/RimL family protein N-acetyltransferase